MEQTSRLARPNPMIQTVATYGGSSGSASYVGTANFSGLPSRTIPLGPHRPRLASGGVVGLRLGRYKWGNTFVSKKGRERRALLTIKPLLDTGPTAS